MMRLQGPGTAVLAATTLSALVLTGCQSEESPTASSSPSASSASPSPSATTASPTPSASSTSEIPPAARKKTDAGAEAFARYFFEQVNAAWMAPNSDLIKQLSDKGCKSCAALTKTASDLERDGQRYREVPIDIRTIFAAKGAPKGQLYLDASLVQNVANVVDDDGEVVLTDPEMDFERTVALRWTEDGWLVFGLV